MCLACGEETYDIINHFAGHSEDMRGAFVVKTSTYSDKEFMLRKRYLIRFVFLGRGPAVKKEQVYVAGV